MTHFLNTEAAHIRAQFGNAKFILQQSPEQQARTWKALYDEMHATADRLDEAAAEHRPHEHPGEGAK
ncbi:MAG: hypothetical protein ACR2PR_09350 [Pseudohongiellaceae bacterium]